MPFRDIEVDEFIRDWERVHARVFPGHHPEDQPFVADWSMTLLVGGLILPITEFTALHDIALTYDPTDTVLAATGRSPIFPLQPIYVLDWEHAALDFLARDSVLSHITSCLFPRSGGWGLCTSYQGFGVLGGPSAFVEAVEAQLGGRTAMQARFRTAEACNAIGVTDDPHWQQCSRKLRAQVGWIDAATAD